MPCVGFKCPLNGAELPFHSSNSENELFGQMELPIGCIYCPDRCYSLGILSGILGNIQERGKVISATRLLYCMREEYLKYKYPYYVNPTTMWAALWGTAIHNSAAMIDNQQNAKNQLGIIAEKRYSKTLHHEGNPVEITGQPDYMSITEQCILDYKTMLKEEYFVKALVYGMEDRIFADKMNKYTLQLNMYAHIVDFPVRYLYISWIVPSGEFISGESYPVTRLSRSMQIKFFDFLRRKTLDGVRSKAPEYHQRIQKYYALRRQYEAEELLFEVPPIEVMDRKEVENALYYRSTQLFRALEYDEIPRKAPMELLWKCRNKGQFCAVWHQCKLFDD